MKRTQAWMVAIVATACVAVALGSEGGVRGADSMLAQFREFGTKYNKTYASEAEWQVRFLKFTHNMKKIEELNTAELKNGNKVAPYGVTEFADMDAAEFKATKLGFVWSNWKPMTSTYDAPRVAIPASVDWRQKGAITPVKNQGQCGSCWAFSATEEVESMWFLAGHPLVELSVQQVVSCDKTDHGCGGGEPYNAYKYMESVGGLDTGAAYPYTDKNGDDDNTCHFKKSGVAAHISGFKYATKNSDETVMQQVVATVGPISTCVEADTWQFYTGGIITSLCGRALDHCVQTIGYGVDDGVNYWLVRNSWGQSWGENGYIRIEIGKDLCGIADEATYVTI